METQFNYSLKKLNTFGIDVNAKQFIKASTLQELKTICKTIPAKDLFILGGGSNMLLTQDLDQTVVKIELKGIEITDQDAQHVWIKAQAGENWHDFVLWCVARDFGGLENLSLIPGCVGTTPIQNIGAYGVEIKDTFSSCEALHKETAETKTFLLDDCQFAYRDSIFKKELKDQYIITSVTFKLTQNHHQLKTEYGAIQTELEQAGITFPSIQDISNAVIRIRESKLPNPAKIGNGGSFFKNPVIETTHFQQLQTHFPDMPFYKLSETQYKIPAAWLIEQAGFKGIRHGDAGVHNKQALVLVNHGSAKGSEIVTLAQTIQKSVLNTFQIQIEPEVNIF